MAIYLDANVLWRWVRLNEPERLALSIVAHQLDQDVLAPEIAVIEAEAELRRRLEEEMSKLDSAQAGLERLLGRAVEIAAEPMPDIDEQLEIWRGQLEDFATILPLHDDDAQRSLRREIEGRLPARPREKGKHGAGSRDAAVWLTVLRDHCRREETGHLISNDRKAFADPGKRLHSDLDQEIKANGGHELSYYFDTAALVERLGEEGPDRELELGVLASLAFGAIRSELESSPLPPRILWRELDPELRYRTDVTAAELREITSQHRYVVGDRAVLAINSRWLLVVTTWWQPRGTDQPGTWSGVKDNEIEAELQLLIEEDAGELGAVKLIGSKLASRVTLSMQGDGSIMSVAEIDP